MDIAKIGKIIYEFGYLKTRPEKIGAMAIEIDRLRDEVEKVRLEGKRETLEAVENHRMAIEKQNEVLNKILYPKDKK
jgi:hypothetical protein